MGLNENGVRALCFAKQQGVDFCRCAMLGRQGLYLTSRWLFCVLREAGLPVGDKEVKSLFESQKGYAEPLFSLLGATETDSYDASGYEGATQVHDFNVPLPSSFHQKYTTVLDSGKLEHGVIFLPR